MPDQTERKRAEPVRSPMARIRATRGGLMSSFRLAGKTSARHVRQPSVHRIGEQIPLISIKGKMILRFVD